ncbi:hypothetical protein BST79_gp077 [Only Syngen Nebraska virus 5]|uniref:hypothetical protein n=1 Tax=Only Syngen Nebraska virus 5 TaxID=1917232 RepID=UPI0009011E2B|nr:hypothetical protein BST79_gp077 [Only Syngen Nebraska virus 5]APC25590.1 hypothetical protein [Only Syngen Nebraska virus 5]
MVDMETFKTTLFSCGCGYKTLNSGSASKHKKTACGHTMTSKTEEFILKNDMSNVQPVHNTVNGDYAYIDQKQITFNLIVPNGDTRTVIYKALKSPQFQRELNGEYELEKIPALIFRHAKGSAITKDGPEKLVRVEDDKVHERDMNGNITKTTLNKYTKKFIGDATNSIEANEHLIECKYGKELVQEFTAKNLPGHKRNEKVSAAEALKNYASGSHVVYKYPAGTRKVVDSAVGYVRKAIIDAGKT